MKNLIISADCTCDLTEELLEKYEIEQMYFYVSTDTGFFRDGDEITALNVFECMGDGQTVTSSAPPVDDYVGYFGKLLKRAGEVIHLTISSGCSKSYEHSMEAVSRLGEDGKRVHVIDSRHLSSGLGHLVLKTAEAAASGKPMDEIICEAEAIREKISTSFITKDAEYLYINGKISAWKAKLIRRLRVHPILAMKNGEISLKGFLRGDYERAQLKYVRKELKETKRVDRRVLFITHAGCTARELERIKAQVDTIGCFKSVYVTNASATVSSNCGPETIGAIYITK